MLPNYFYNNNYTIVQTPDHIVILAEMVHDTRIIRMNAKAHINARNQPWLGDSIGRWEGDTLVVETTNIHPMQREQTSILWAYRGASENLKVTERFTRTGPDTIVYRFTMEDPRPCSPRRSPASCPSRRSTRWSTSTRATKATTR